MIEAKGSNNSVVLNTSSADETMMLGEKFAQSLSAGDVVTLDGDLGAGKTHFAQGVGTGLGIKEPMTSPTFNIVFEYKHARTPLYHFDLYRLEDVSELEDVDFYALTDESSGGIALIEWANKFAEEIPDNAINVFIEKTGDSSRKIHIASRDDQKFERIQHSVSQK